MHFSIPDTSECTDPTGSNYTVFNIHINGVYHCSVRYKQFHNFHEQLKREFTGTQFPPFPPKKLLALNSAQLEERRAALERYLQTVSQSPNIASSDLFNGFLLSAQQESQREDAEDVVLDVYLMNGHRISISILSTDQTDDVLETVASQIELMDDFVYYFGLFLIRKESGSENTIVRKLQEFESPFISLKAANRSATHRIVLRKSFWDPSFEDDLMGDRIAMNLLYVQAVSDLERGWVWAPKDQQRQLNTLQQRGSKKEYLELARTLKYYGFTQFKPCFTDYPHADCRVIVSAGNKELNFRIQMSHDEVKEVTFRVTRMRCWRISSVISDQNGDMSNGDATLPSNLELAFEYLVAKDTLKWITVHSDQAILMSMCLQGMVDELILKKSGKKIKRPQDRNRASRKNGKEASSVPFPYLPSSNSEPDTPTSFLPPKPLLSPASLPSPSPRDPVKKISDRLSGKSSERGQGLTQNDMFLETGIGDDDL
ncbi:hypothetical protein CAPTEDRAFT_150546 [Capitella teleta]|uniref:PX domain-containing protein n=1 Tax=Capitella teleta TaxID=283909 RepID=R7VHJ1_CAPTE|nr:hypothetical protein CAPTEDRAFT_150546 [Capitella teleta]|eukprot:ELU18303.1 hypothetical protein CAPTEDRAFT_150546 [Capitella teleta]